MVGLKPALDPLTEAVAGGRGGARQRTARDPLRRPRRRFRGGLVWLAAAAAVVAGAGCDDADSAATSMRLDPTAADFYAMPYPNDLRLNTATRTIDLGDFPNPATNVLAEQLIAAAAEQRDGFALMPVVSFAFDGPLDPVHLHTDLQTVPSEPYTAYFIDVDPGSPAYGEVIPAAGMWYPGAGNYVTRHTMTLIPWPGKVLRPKTIYAAVVETAVAADPGDPGTRPGSGRARVAPALAAALNGEAPDGPRGQLVADLYHPLAQYLAEAGSAPAVDDVLAATVFTTGDPVGEMQALADRVLATERAELAGTPAMVRLEPDYCYYEGAVTLPVYQLDDPPFRAPGTGRIAFEEDGDPVRQGYDEIKFTLTIPRQPMPAAGYPYVEYIHGSGGLASQLVDRGPVPSEGAGETPWQGPAWIAARRGFAAGSHAMPISPDRVTVPVMSFDYFQLSNVAVVRDNFRQGVWELLLRRRMLYGMELSAASCPGASSPDGTLRFDPDHHYTTGQSMGAMYANMFGALATDTAAVYPTGSGGYWSYFIFTTDLIPGAGELVSTLGGFSRNAPADPRHPLIGITQQMLEKIDPIVFLPHLVERPLPGVPAKHLLVPHGRNDLYFSTETQRAMAIAYGVPRIAGVELDAGMDEHMALFDLPAPVATPVRANVPTGDGGSITGGQAQWREDPVQENGHVVTFQYEALQHQWGCFFQTAYEDGVPTIVERGGGRFEACR